MVTKACCRKKQLNFYILHDYIHHPSKINKNSSQTMNLLDIYRICAK